MTRKERIMISAPRLHRSRSLAITLVVVVIFFLSGLAMIVTNLQPEKKDEATPVPTADLRTPVLATPYLYSLLTPLPEVNQPVETPHPGNTMRSVSLVPEYFLILTTPEGEEIRIREIGPVGHTAEMSINRYEVNRDGVPQLYDIIAGDFDGAHIVSKGFVVIEEDGWQYRYEKIE